MIRLLLADDQDLVREGLRLILDLADGIEVVAEAGDGRQAVDLTRRLEPDVVLMDLRMPVMDGVEATRRIASMRTPAKILVLTTFDDDELVYEAFQAGASGFLLKDIRQGQLVHAVRAVLHGDALLSPTITRRLVEGLATQPCSDTPATKMLDHLTERERGILHLIAQGHTNAEIANALYLAESTVKTHVSRILAKLQLRDRVQAVIFAYEAGVIRPGQRPETRRESDDGRGSA